MANVIISATKVAAAIGVVPALVCEITTLIQDIVALYDDVKSTSPMLTELIEQVQSEEPLIQRLLDGGTFPTAQASLEKFRDHLAKIKVFLDVYRKKNIVRRLLGLRKTKDFIRAFYTERELIHTHLNVECHESGAVRLVRLESQNQRLHSAMEKQHEEILANIKANKDGLSKFIGPDIVSVLTDIRHETRYRDRDLTATEKEQFQWISRLLRKETNEEPASVSTWYISEGDISVDEAPVETGESSSLFYGTLSSGASVAVTKMQFAGELDVKGFNVNPDVWYKLRNPHVLPLYGANVTPDKPAFFVTPRAAKSNFNAFLPSNPHLFWKVFLDVSRGLAYLHSRSPPIVHTNVKCSNLLVMADGTGVVSDFALSFARAHSAMSDQPKKESSLSWRAPECLRLGNPRVESDVYSLGMCLVEAFTGARPYEGLTDDEIVDKVCISHELPVRSANIPDDAWMLITRMCDKSFQKRFKMQDVIDQLQLFVEDERVKRERLVCSCDSKVCNSCGKRSISRNECP